MDGRRKRRIDGAISCDEQDNILPEVCNRGLRSSRVFFPTHTMRRSQNSLA